MVKELHKANIEVILDVVYNHTAEGNHLGPTLCLPWIRQCFLLQAYRKQSYYMDYTGTGNTLNARMPAVLRLIMDSLRYWILDMHVDGFRFDLAATLARELHEVDRLSAFFDIIHQDPVISQVKLIAEPWDIGEGGYQVENFLQDGPNGMENTVIASGIIGVAQTVCLAEFAERFTGSSDLYKADYRRPTASVNFVTAHDGFTLNDLVSYNEKHNEANGENNKDGENHNRSWNCGVEGPTDNPEIIALRNKQKRNFLTTLMLSQGVPMLVSGDEIGKTQRGNNNAYCQDNEISWIDWVMQIRNCFYSLKSLSISVRSTQISEGDSGSGAYPSKGQVWKTSHGFCPEGREMSEENWSHDYAKSLAIFMNGEGIRTVGPKGERTVDNSFYLMFNAHYEGLDFKLPRRKYGYKWMKVIDTHENLFQQ